MMMMMMMMMMIVIELSTPQDDLTIMLRCPPDI
jgi:hypothetical protein